MCLSQQQFDAAVVHQKTQAILRVIRVQWHVCATGLEDRQHPYNHVQTAFSGQPHANIRANALLAQFMGQLVGAAVELLIAQLLASKSQSDGQRRALGLSFNALMGAIFTWINRKVRVPVAQSVLPLIDA